MSPVVRIMQDRHTRSVGKIRAFVLKLDVQRVTSVLKGLGSNGTRRKEKSFT
jgi:hypothetical protein